MSPRSSDSTNLASAASQHIADSRRLKAARYSVSKCKAFAEYRRSASSLRILAVIVLTLLPALGFTLLPPLIHLHDPNEGYKANCLSFLTHFTIAITLTTIASTITYRADADISHDDYSTATVMVTSLLTSLWLVLCSWVGIAAWRFPIPFHVTLVYVPGLVGFTFVHYMVLRTRLHASTVFQKQIAGYLPCFAIYAGQMVIYPAYSAAYHASDEWLKVVLTLFFPLVKYSLKRSIRKFSDPTLEQSEEMIVGSIEIAATVYQSMIMQSTPSTIVTVLIIGVDVVQGVVEIRHMMDKHSVVAQENIIVTAIHHLEHWDLSDEKLDQQLTSYGSPKKSSLRMIIPHGAVAPTLIDKRRVTSGAEQRKKIVVVHALEILQAAEKILLVEYIEIVVPVVNGIYLVVASQLHSAVYNTSIAEFYFHPGRLVPAQLSLALYVGLQVLSLVVIAIFMRMRFQLPPLTLLSFHLERHAWSFQGKMVSWFSLLLQFSLLHYGTDFSFRFRFRVPTADDYP